MSNTQVGAVYQQIISDVIDSSRVDFEETGVDEHVLEELRMVSLLPSFWLSIKPIIDILPFQRISIICSSSHICIDVVTPSSRTVKA